MANRNLRLVTFIQCLSKQSTERLNGSGYWIPLREIFQSQDCKTVRPLCFTTARAFAYKHCSYFCLYLVKSFFLQELKRFVACIAHLNSVANVRRKVWLMSLAVLACFIVCVVNGLRRIRSCPKSFNGASCTFSSVAFVIGSQCYFLCREGTT